MKKILTLLAVMVAVLASCNKNEIAPSEKGTCANLKLDVSVSYPGEQTKALIKEGWTNGDQIKIWYGTNTEANPDLVIKYDGTGWETEGTPTTPPSASGTLKAVYSDNVTVAANDIGYTFAGETISFNINNWIFLTEVQVVVKDLEKTKADKYALACDRFTPVASSGEKYTVTTTEISANPGTKGDAVTGISNSDGVAFVFATAEYSSAPADFIFTLTDNTSGTVNKIYLSTGKTLLNNKSVIKAIKISGSNFVTNKPVSSVTAANNFIGTNEENAKSVDLTGATITAGDVKGDKTIHFVLTDKSPRNLVSFALPDIPQDLKDNCTGWTIMSETDYPTEKVIVNAPNGSCITVLAPKSHVILTGESYTDINARTGDNTLVVPSGVTIANLTVEQGAVEIHGTVTSLTVSPVEGKKVLFRSCEGLSQDVFDKIKKDQVYDYIDPSYYAVQNQNGTWNIVLSLEGVPSNDDWSDGSDSGFNFGDDGL